MPEDLNGPGYEEIGTGVFVPKEDAYKFALERMSMNKKEQEEFEDWYFSGNFIYTDGGEQAYV